MNLSCWEVKFQAGYDVVNRRPIMRLFQSPIFESDNDVRKKDAKDALCKMLVKKGFSESIAEDARMKVTHINYQPIDIDRQSLLDGDP